MLYAKSTSLWLSCLAALVILGLTLPTVFAAYCHGAPKPDAKPNLTPINVLPPVFVNSTTNGKLFTIGGENNIIRVLHVWGTPYEMGVAHGTLLKGPLHQFIPELWKYLEEQIISALPKLPAWLAEFIASRGLAAALDLTYEITKKYSGSYFFEELQGIADASGLDYRLLRRIHMIGEVTKAQCSMFGAWGAATAGGKTLQLRALDWDTQGPFKNFPALVVYHPNEGNGHPFINAGFVGWIGSITGMSSTQMAISEIGVSYPDDSFGSESRVGVPFTFLLRDILQFDLTLDDAINRITSARRTCNLILGVGDAKLKTFRGFQYSHSVANVIDDINLIPKNDTWHPPISNMVYFGMDWLCPSFTSVLGRQLQALWGKLTPESAVESVLPIVQTGDLQIAIYDLTSQELFISYAKADYQTGPKYAYDRQYTRVDAKALFNEQRP